MKATDKDREEAIPSDPKKLAEMVLHHIKLGDIRCYRCEMTAKKVVETHDSELARIRAEAKAEVAYGSHVLYNTGDVDAPEQIKDGNGEVCLGMCRNCGRAESELSEVCDRRKAKAATLSEAAEKADEALVEWFDPFRMYDVEKDLGEIRHKVEYAIMHGDEPQTPEQAQKAADDRAYEWRHDMMGDEPKAECSWRFDGDLWSSECGLCWEFPERGPAENGVVYCPRCGKLVRDETKEGE